MYRKYQCVCRFCGKIFNSANVKRDVCQNAECQKRKRNSLKKVGGSPAISITEVERMAENYSMQLKKTVTYGQVSLLLECGIKTF